MGARALSFLLVALPSFAFAPVTSFVQGIADAGVPDKADVDCNRNGVPDGMDVAAELSNDDDGDGAADECCQGKCKGADCNENGIEDTFDLVLGNSLDCNCNAVPDECEDAAPCDPPGRNGRRGGMTPPGLPPPGEDVIDLPVCGRGSASVAQDDLGLVFSGLPPSAAVVVVAGNLTVTPEAGLVLAKGQVELLGFAEVFEAEVDELGRVVFAHPIVQAAPGFVRIGDTIRFQCMFYDAQSGVQGFTRSYVVTYVN